MNTPEEITPKSTPAAPVDGVEPAAASPAAEGTAALADGAGPGGEGDAPADTAQSRGYGVKRAAMSSAVWTVGGFGVMQVLRFACNIILARLLFPEIFSLITLVNTFIVGVHLFSDVGIGPSIIQSKNRDDPNFLNTAWTLQVLRGIGVWFCLGLLAWPVSVYYEQPELLWLLPVAGFGEMMASFNSTALYTLTHRLMRGRQVLLEIGVYAVSMAVMILWVLYIEKSVWALVAGAWVSNILTMAISHFLLKDIRNRLRWDPQAVRELLHFGKWIFVSTLFTFLAGQSDRLIVGKISFDKLGIYYFALMLANIPPLLMFAFKDQLVFPLYNRFHESGRDLREAFSRMHPAMIGFGAMLVSGLIATGPTAVKCLYDHRYQEAGWMLQFLAVGVWFQILEAIGGAVLWAIGRSRSSAISNGFKVFTLFIFAPVWLWFSQYFYTEYPKPDFRYPDTVNLARELNPAENVFGVDSKEALYYWKVEHQKGKAATIPEGNYLVDAQGDIRYALNWKLQLIGLILVFVLGDFIRYAVTFWVVRQEKMPILRYDLAVTLLIVATSLAAFAVGDAFWPDRVSPDPLKKDFQYNLVRFLILGVSVVAQWAALGIIAWLCGLFRAWHEKEDETPER